MMADSFQKDPHATLDYQMDWSAWLNGDTLTASTWTVPTGLTEASSSFADTTSTVWLSGGVSGTTYTVINHVTTAGSRVDDRSIVIQVRER